MFFLMASVVALIGMVVSKKIIASRKQRLHFNELSNVEFIVAGNGPAGDLKESSVADNKPFFDT